MAQRLKSNAMPCSQDCQGCFSKIQLWKFGTFSSFPLLSHTAESSSKWGCLSIYTFDFQMAIYILRVISLIFKKFQKF